MLDVMPFQLTGAQATSVSILLPSSRTWRIIGPAPRGQTLAPQTVGDLKTFWVDEIHRAFPCKNVKGRCPEEFQCSRICIDERIASADQDRIRRHIQHLPVFVHRPDRLAGILQPFTQGAVFGHQYAGPDKHDDYGKTEHLFVWRRSRRCRRALRPGFRRKHQEYGGAEGRSINIIQISLHKRITIRRIAAENLLKIPG